jgi:thiamine-phosphate pyrophosphorylase
MSFAVYLVSPVIADAAPLAGTLAAAVTALKPASVLLRLAPGDERSQINLIKALAPLAQDAGAAVLVDASPMVAVRGGADGVHVATADLVGGAREALKNERIVGVGGLASRHDAMDAGENGADYVMFGEPRADGAILPLPALIDRASWWAEIFETPCVAYCADADAVAPVAGTGAEFLALGPWAFDQPETTAALVATARARLAGQGR